MIRRPRTLTFDVDPASAATLREALPEWVIEPTLGASVASLFSGEDLGAVDLVVVGARASATETLALCRVLGVSGSRLRRAGQTNEGSLVLRWRIQRQARRVEAPLLVLVAPEQMGLVQAALEAGAQCCLELPITVSAVAGVLSRARAGNRPGHHTGNHERAQDLDLWQDDGGQG